MPFSSDAQRRYFNANRDELESQGVDVDEWNELSKGKDLPEKVDKEAQDKQANLLQMLRQLLSPRLAMLGARGQARAATQGRGPGSLISRGQASPGKGIAEQLFGKSPQQKALRRSVLQNAGQQAQIRQLQAGGVGAGVLGGANAVADAGQGAVQSAQISDLQQQLARLKAPTQAPQFVVNPAPSATKSSSYNLGLKAARCWEGYKPVPGKKPYSEDSCRPETDSKEKKSMDTKQAGGCGGKKKKKQKMAQSDLKKAATAGLQRYLAHLHKQAQAEGSPLHYKRAADERLVKLSQSLARTGDLWTSLGAVYPELDAEKRFKVAQDIASNMFRWLGKRAMGGAATAGTSTLGAGMKMAPSSSQTMPAKPGMRMAM